MCIVVGGTVKLVRVCCDVSDVDLESIQIGDLWKKNIIYLDASSSSGGEIAQIACATVSHKTISACQRLTADRVIYLKKINW